MTLNQLIRRLETIITEHKQIRSFHRGYIADRVNDKDVKYPLAILQDNGGNVGVASRQTTFNFRLMLLDLVHVSMDTKANELDVQSDLVSVMLDLLTQFNRGELNWKVSGENIFQLTYEGDTNEGTGDMPAGLYVDFTISVLYPQNVCEVPTRITNYSTL